MEEIKFLEALQDLAKRKMVEILPNGNVRITLKGYLAYHPKWQYLYWVIRYFFFSLKALCYLSKSEKGE